MSKAKLALGAIRDLPDDELVQSADKARDDLFRLKLSSYTNQVQDTASVRKKRRELARILTIMTARRQGTQAQGAAPAKAPVAAKVAAPKKVKAKHVPAPKATAEKADKAEKVKAPKKKAATEKAATAKATAKKTAKKKEG